MFSKDLQREQRERRAKELRKEQRRAEWAKITDKFLYFFVILFAFVFIAFILFLIFPELQIFGALLSKCIFG